MRAPDGSFSKRLTDLVDGFDGPVAVLVPPEGEEPALHASILVPVTGTDVSRRGAEMALVIAKAAQTEVSALYVTPGTQPGGHRTGAARKRC